MAAQPGQQQGADNSLAMLWGIALVFAIAWLVWYFFHAQIAGTILRVRLLEARFIAWFISDAKALPSYCQSFTPAAMQAGDLANISEAVGRYLRYPVGVILLMLALFIYTGRASLRFKKSYNMDDLVEAEKKNWRQITPVVKLNLVGVDIDTGPWAMALSPLQFARKNHLIRLERVEPTVVTSVTAVSHVVANLQREAARRSFVIQLQSYWSSPHQLPLPTRALFAIFSARAARDRESANRLLLQIADSAICSPSDDHAMLTQRLNFSGTDELLRRYGNEKKVIQVTQKHAYVLTVMASMLQLARQDGVLASAEFLWLKPVNRTLWFMLNSVGRQTAFPEVAGPFAHWIAECALGRRLLVPMVDMAVNALEIALKEVRLSEETLLEYANS